MKNVKEKGFPSHVYLNVRMMFLALRATTKHRMKRLPCPPIRYWREENSVAMAIAVPASFFKGRRQEFAFLCEGRPASDLAYPLTAEKHRVAFLFHFSRTPIMILKKEEPEINFTKQTEVRKTIHAWSAVQEQTTKSGPVQRGGDLAAGRNTSALPCQLLRQWRKTQKSGANYLRY